MIMTEANLDWVWKGYPYEDWAWDEMNGWSNPEDDPASPTETLLLNQIEALHLTIRRVENENIALATANSELRSEVRELRALLRGVTHG